MRSVALDMGAKKISFCEVAHGQVLQRATLSSLSGLEPLLGPQTQPARVAVEACREAWHVHTQLSEWGHQVLLVDTTRVRQVGVGQHRRKTDRIDAEVLALAVERGSIPAAHILSAHRQELRLQLSVRRALVETRAQYVVTVRGLLRARGIATPNCDADAFHRRMRQVKLPPELDTLIAPIMSVLDELGTKLLKVHDRLEQLCAQEPAILQLTTVHGVGLVVAAIFVSVIDEARRFESRHQVGSYLGLVPSEYSSGDTRRVGAITRCGNRYVRAALIQAAWSYMRNGPDDPIKQWAHQVAGRRGRRIAVIALARRLACIMWAMWRDGTVYDANLVGKRPALRREQSLELRAGALGRAKHKTRALAQRVERAARP